MQPTSEQLATAVTSAAGQALSKAVQQIKHCLGQLSDEQVWWRPTEAMNSIGNLVLHLCGNIRQWIVAGIGGKTDVRERPREFAERALISRAELLRRLDDVMSEAGTALQAASCQDLLRSRRIQGFHVTGIEAIFDAIPHFKGHTQEITYVTRLLLRDAYSFSWIPSTPEEGA